MKPKLIYSIIFLFFCCSAFGQSVYDYPKTIEYGNVTLSVKDVKDIVSAIQGYHTKLVKNNSSHTDTLEFELSLNNHYNDKISDSTFNQAQNLTLNHSYTEIRIYYNCRYPEANLVSFWCSNHSRYLLVRGPQKKQVEALFGQINSIIKKKETKLSPIKWDSFMTFFYTFSTMLIVRFLGIMIGKLRKKQNILKAILGIVLCCIYIISLFIAAFSSTFLGTIFSRVSISPGIFSWTDVNTNFAGVSSIAVLLGGLVYIIYGWFKQAKFRTG